MKGYSGNLQIYVGLNRKTKTVEQMAEEKGCSREAIKKCLRIIDRDEKEKIDYRLPMQKYYDAFGIENRKKIDFLHDLYLKSRLSFKSEENKMAFIGNNLHDNGFKLRFKKHMEDPKNRGLFLSIDHVIPKSKGGTDEPGNLKVVFFSENWGKNNLSKEEYDRMEMAKTEVRLEEDSGKIELLEFLAKKYPNEVKSILEKMNEL